jgi:hypothetical protein
MSYDKGQYVSELWEILQKEESKMIIAEDTYLHLICIFLYLFVEF